MYYNSKIQIFFSYSKAREELSSKTQKLTEVLSDYGDVVPRREFEHLEKQLKVLSYTAIIFKKNNQFRKNRLPSNVKSVKPFFVTHKF